MLLKNKRFILGKENKRIESEEFVMSEKRLYKSDSDKMLCGVCGGIAEYFRVDPTIVRLAWAIFTCVGGAGIWAYIIAAIIIPQK